MRIFKSFCLFILFFYRFNESNDEFMIKKLDYTRTNALLTQQIEFLNKKIEENQATMETNQKKYEERLCKHSFNF